MVHCPCGSGLNYDACCGIYHHKFAKAANPETLMRSRYTAYTMGDMDYIKKTMYGKPLIGFDEKEATLWSKSVLWLGLQVLKTQQESEHTGLVEFIAKYLDQDRVKSIHELSQFQLINDSWFYIDGKQFRVPNKEIGRNSPCPCGSNKKFKNCHG